MAALIEALEAARNRDFGATLHAEYSGAALPLVGAAIRFEVRLYAGAAGVAAAAQSSVPFSDAATPTTAEPDLRTLTCEPSLSRAAMQRLPGLNQPEAGAAQRFEYEIMIIYADGKRDALWAGDFNISPGVVA